MIFHHLTLSKATPRGFIISLVSALTMLLSGCASNLYVDTALKDVPAAEFKKTEQARSVQLVFEFQTKGAPNSIATEHLKQQVTTQVMESGLFSAAPIPSQNAMLYITINNIPLTSNAVEQGFVSGLTFGAVGAAVSDGYICTVAYLAPGQSAAISKISRHAIHATLGNADAPPNATKAKDANEAITTVTRQLLANAMRDLSHDAQFQ